LNTAFKAMRAPSIPRVFMMMPGASRSDLIYVKHRQGGLSLN